MNRGTPDSSIGLRDVADGPPPGQRRSRALSVDSHQGMHSLIPGVTTPGVCARNAQEVFSKIGQDGRYSGLEVKE